jgi:hypothetical protein
VGFGGLGCRLSVGFLSSRRGKSICCMAFAALPTTPEDLG